MVIAISVYFLGYEGLFIVLHHSVWIRPETWVWVKDKDLKFFLTLYVKTLFFTDIANCKVNKS